MLDQVEQRVRSAQPEYPPAKSAMGTNAHTVQCQCVGRQQSYAVCLNKIMAYERDKGLKSYVDCERAICDGECPALEMRQEEKDAGKALYYLDREMLRAAMDEHFAQSSYMPSARARQPRPVSAFAAATVNAPSSPASKPKPASKSVAVPDLAQDGYAAAINAAIKEESASKESAKTESESIATPTAQKKGLSLLEMARMQINKPKGQ